jgi:OOP family OmpA-OmpF porin
MKKFLFFMVVIFLSVDNLSSQSAYNSSSIGFSIGNHFGIKNQGSSARIFIPSHLNFNYRYMFNNKVGLMSSFGYDRFSFKNNVTPSNYYKISIEASVNLREILGFSEFVEHFGALAHGGLGVSGMWSKNIATQNIYTKTNFDQLLHITLGLTPRYRINNKYCVHVDLTYLTNLNQDFTYDTRTVLKPKEGFAGSFLNFSAGVTMSIGPRKHHADWYTFPTLIDKDLEKINLLEIQLEQLEMKLEDYDGDGVSNYLDDEPNTPKGNLVDTRGVSLDKLQAPEGVNELDSMLNVNNTIKSNTTTEKTNPVVKNSDRDGDGVPDIYDLFPDIVGTYKGIPDADGDQIPDIIDDCPNTKGSQLFHGCPEKKIENISLDNVPEAIIKQEPKLINDEKPKLESKVEEKTFSDVFFDIGTSSLSIKTTNELDKLAKYLKENPKAIVSVIGFADQTGSAVANEKLSKKRASECVNYIVKKGIDSKRFSISNQTAINTTNESTLVFGAKNRKVSFIVKE